MAFCKVCTCGEKIVFERRLSFPDNCPNCGRRLMDFAIYPEDDPIVDVLISQAKDAAAPEPPPAAPAPAPADGPCSFALRLPDGAEIEIPAGGCIIGRIETGAEQLSAYGSVSRQHLRLTPRRSSCVIAEDISRYGTLIDGKRLDKNTPVRVLPGAKITLCNVDTQLVKKDGQS